MQSFKEIVQKCSSMTKNNSSPTLETKVYECEICKDTGIESVSSPEWDPKERMYKNDSCGARICKCVESKNYKKMYEKSGIAAAFKKKTIENYDTAKKPKAILTAKNTALEYIRAFPKIREEQNNSIAFLGQVGAGKTHLSIGIANALMESCIAVLYMQYREAITQLKQCITDEEAYQRQLNKYRTATVLLVDDLYKGMLNRGGVNDSELRILFEIINYRYLNCLPIIVSSEYGMDRILEFDEAIGSRIMEMCKGHVIEFEGMELNHRLGA